MDAHRQLRKLEESLLLPTTRKDTARLSRLLADEFREYGSSGCVYSKTEIIESLQTESVSHLSLSGFEVLPLTETVALVTYQSVKRVPGSPPSESLRSSIWRLRDGQWQILFHQGTTIPATSG